MQERLWELPGNGPQQPEMAGHLADKAISKEKKRKKYEWERHAAPWIETLRKRAEIEPLRGADLEDIELPMNAIEERAKAEGVSFTGSPDFITDIIAWGEKNKVVWGEEDQIVTAEVAESLRTACTPSPSESTH